MVSIYNTAKEYIANAITMTRGTVADITQVGIYINVNPATIPAVASFTTVTLVDGTSDPPDPLSIAGEVDVLTLVGTAGDITPTAGDYQVWILVKTSTENIIRKVDTLTIL